MTLELKDIFSIAMLFVITGLGVAFGLNILSDIKEDFGENGCASGYVWNTSAQNCYLATNSSITTNVVTAEWNATESTQDTVVKFPEKMPIIASVLIAGLIIGVLVKYLVFNRN